ncbi:MAG: NADPH-dependent FMN reductase [Lutibacter sp.]
MKKLLTMAGSSSIKSINKQLATYAGSLLKDAEIIAIDLNDYAMPIYSVDEEEANGFPKSAKALSKKIEEVDGIILSLAEHNGAYSAAFKNVFDWLSRIEGKVWRNKPMLLMATSPGARGGQSVLEIALNRFPYNGGNIIGTFSLPSFYENFIDGKISNDNFNDILIRETIKLKSEL